MMLCVSGDTHGAIDRLYAEVVAFEGALGARFDHVLHVGDFGVWPDPSRIDKATRNHEGAGDFPAWFIDRRRVPRPTLFVKGNHEDFEWLERRREAGELELLPGLTYLPNGHITEIGPEHGRIRVGGIGGCHGPKDYGRRSSELRQRARRHFTRDEVQALCSRGPVDVLLLHDAPAGVEFVWRREDGSVRRRTASEANGLAEVVARTRPRLCFFGHHHVRFDTEVAGVRCIGLNKVPCAGSLVAVDIERGAQRCRILGAWPGRESDGPHLSGV